MTIFSPIIIHHRDNIADAMSLKLVYIRYYGILVNCIVLHTSTIMIMQVIGIYTFYSSVLQSELREACYAILAHSSIGGGG